MLIMSLLASCAFAQRVVSLLPSATYMAVQMGADAHIVGRTSYCPAPAAGGKSTIVGDAMTVNVEAIVALSPDVVIASPFTSKAVVDKLSALRIRVRQLPTPKDFDEICSQTIVVGRLLGCEAQARQLVERERGAVDGILAGLRRGGSLGFYIQIGVNPLWGATPDYYIGDLISRLGGRNVLAVGEGACSRESIVARAPGVIVVSSLGGLGEGEAAEWRRLTKARVVVVDESELCCPTPVFFRKSLKSIADAL